MEDFEKYLPYVIPMLQGAAVHCARLDHEDEDLKQSLRTSKYGDNEVTKAGVTLIESSDDQLKETVIWTRKMILRALVAGS
ncbi:hypothetical protein AAC387_Pa01g3936 [Persea americana]